MERSDPADVALFHDEAMAAGELAELDGAASRHAMVRRVRRGDAARLVDGRGTVGIGTFASVGRKAVSVTVDRVVYVARPVALELIVPVADRDRMLWAAEKCVEHQVTAWRPVLYARSRSVSTRGEGERFAEKVRARMIAALEQCGGAWLPELHRDAEFHAVLTAVPATHACLVLDAPGRHVTEVFTVGPAALAVGPEGGFEAEELAAARDAGWITASLGQSTLRFETAAISGAAVIRALQLSTQGA